MLIRKCEECGFPKVRTVCPDCGAIHYRAQETKVKFHRSDARVRSLIGPFGTGKSVACVIELIRRARMQHPCLDNVRRTRWVVVRNTFRQLRDTTIKTFAEWVKDGMHGRMVWHPLPNFYFTEGLDDGTKVESEFMFRALDRPEQLDNLFSLEFTGYWINECREIKKEVKDGLDSRWGRYPPAHLAPADWPENADGTLRGWPTWYGGLLDTNPMDWEHWFYKLFEKKVIVQKDGSETPLQNPGSHRVWHCPKGENPFLPPGYYEEISLGKSQAWINVFVEGQYGLVVEGKVVFPEYRDQAHTRDTDYDPVSDLPIYRGWDIGNTMYPSVVYAQLNNGLEVFDELLAPDHSIHQFKDVVIAHSRELYPGFKFIDYGDPAMLSRLAGDVDARTAQQILAAGMHPIHVKPGATGFTARREAVVRLLLKMLPEPLKDSAVPFFRLSPCCTLLREGFLGRYEYPEIGTTGRYHDFPIQNKWNHPQAALQYLVTGLFTPYEERSPEAKKWRSPRPPSAMAA